MKVYGLLVLLVSVVFTSSAAADEPKAVDKDTLDARPSLYTPADSNSLQLSHVAGGVVVSIPDESVVEMSTADSSDEAEGDTQDEYQKFLAKGRYSKMQTIGLGYSGGGGGGSSYKPERARRVRTVSYSKSKSKGGSSGFASINNSKARGSSARYSGGRIGTGGFASLRSGRRRSR